MIPFVFTVRVDQTLSGECPQRREREIESEILAQHQSISPPVLAHQRDTSANQFLRPASAQFASLQTHGAAQAFSPGAEKVHQQFGSARAHQAAEAQHLSGAQGKGDGLQGCLSRVRIRHGEIFNLEYDRSPRRHSRGEKVLNFAPDHVADDFLFVGETGFHGGNGGPIPEDGDAVGQLEDFVEFVRDVDAGDSALHGP